MWIKEINQEDNKIFIVNAKKYKINILESIEIIKLDKNYKLINTIIAEKANILEKDWILNNVKIYSDEKKQKL